MALLAYCIAEAGANIEIPHSGVQEKPIQTVAESGLTCFVSEYNGGGDRDQIRATAVEFNRVLQDVLQQAAIVPFRFPTLIADESEMRGFLREHAEKYLEDLRRLRGAVQMEVNLTADDSPKATISGADYLRARQARHHKFTATAAAIREALAPWAKDWREHESSGGTRCYVLIPRVDVQSVLQRLQGVKIPGELQARVTGPWPATEFLSRKS